MATRKATTAAILVRAREVAFRLKELALGEGRRLFVARTRDDLAVRLEADHDAKATA